MYFSNANSYKLQTMKHLLTLFLLLALTTAHAQNDTAALMKRALELYDDDEFTAAERIVSNLLLEDSTRADAYWMRGLCRINKGEMDDGLDDLAMTIKLEPKNTDYLTARASVFKVLLRYKDALSDMRMVMSLLPPHQKGVNDTAYLMANTDMIAYCIYNREYDSALVYVDKLFAIDSNDMGAIHNSIIIYIDQKDFAKADKYLKKYTSLAGEEQSPMYLYVWYYVNIGKYKEAIAMADELIKINKRPDGSLYSNKAFAHYKLGELDKAEEAINISLQLDASNSFAYKNRALIYIAQKKFADACEDLRAATELNFQVPYGDEVRELYIEHCSKM